MRNGNSNNKCNALTTHRAQLCLPYGFSPHVWMDLGLVTTLRRRCDPYLTLKIKWGREVKVTCSGHIDMKIWSRDLSLLPGFLALDPPILGQCIILIKTSSTKLWSKQTLTLSQCSSLPTSLPKLSGSFRKRTGDFLSLEREVWCFKSFNWRCHFNLVPQKLLWCPVRWSESQQWNLRGLGLELAQSRGHVCSTLGYQRTGAALTTVKCYIFREDHQPPPDGHTPH